MGAFHGEMSSGKTATFRPGALKADALFLDGRGYVTFTRDPVALGPSESGYTVACWCRLAAPDKHIGNVLLAHEGPERAFISTAIQGGDPSTVGAVFKASGVDRGVAYWNLHDARWHHLVAIYDPPGAYHGRPRGLRLYIDGVLASFGGRGGLGGWNGPFRPSVQGLRLGADHSQSVGFPDLWNGEVDDLAIWARPLGSSEARLIYKVGSERGQSIGDLLSPDSDGDGLPDDWEDKFGLRKSVADAELDADQDGLSNLQEHQLGTNPSRADSDGDGALDLHENKTGKWFSPHSTGTDPLLADTDNDGLLDGRENPSAGPIFSDPNVIDTDDDGLNDGAEVAHGSSPTDGAQLPGLEQGVVAHWSFDADLRDAAGEYHGEAKGAEPIVHVPGRFGNGIRLNGKAQYMTVGGAPDAFDFAEGSHAVAAWIRAERYPPNSSQFIYPTILATGYIDGWSLRTEWDRTAGTLPLSLDVTKNRLWSGHDIGDRAWHHLVGVIDRAALRSAFYVDGVLLARGANTDSTPAIPASPHRLWIGGNPGMTNDSRSWSFWSGLVDEVSIWNRPLAATEVRRLFESQVSLTTLLPPNAPPDTDHDGQPDAAELLAGTDPNPTSRIRFKIRLFSARFVAQSVEDQRSDFPFGL